MKPRKETENIQLIHRTTDAKIDNEFAQHIKKGLGRSNKKKINPKYFYDDIGSQLFETICHQPEYYLTRTEAAILRKYSSDIANLYNRKKISIVELGSGSSAKTRILLHHILMKQQDLYYFPIDVSSSILNETMHKLSADFLNLHTIGISSDYVEGIEKASDFISAKNHIPDRKLILFLGSSIGNFEPKESLSLLRSIRDKMEKNDNLLLGLDLHKDMRVLEAAYNDKEGITSKFNLNLLARINRELEGEFNLDNFSHRAFYNKQEGRVEMHIISRMNQKVHVNRIGQTFSFKKNETIHTENSYKYSLTQIKDMAEDSGFDLKRNFIDEKKWFDVALFSPA